MTAILTAAALVFAGAVLHLIAAACAVVGTREDENWIVRWAAVLAILGIVVTFIGGMQL